DVPGPGQAGRYDPQADVRLELAVRRGPPGRGAVPDGGSATATVRIAIRRTVGGPEGGPTGTGRSRSQPRTPSRDRAAAGEGTPPHPTLLLRGSEPRAGGEPVALAGRDREDPADSRPGAPPVATGEAGAAVPSPAAGRSAAAGDPG